MVGEAIDFEMQYFIKASKLSKLSDCLDRTKGEEPEEWK